MIEGNQIVQRHLCVRVFATEFEVAAVDHSESVILTEALGEVMTIRHEILQSGIALPRRMAPMRYFGSFLRYVAMMKLVVSVTRVPSGQVTWAVTRCLPEVRLVVSV